MDSKRCNKVGGVQPFDDTNLLGATLNLSGVLEMGGDFFDESGFYVPQRWYIFLRWAPPSLLYKFFRFKFVEKSKVKIF